MSQVISNAEKLTSKNNSITIKTPVLVTMYLFFAVRFSPDLLANSLLWISTFVLFIFVSTLCILIYGNAKNRSFVKWYAVFSLYSVVSLLWTTYTQNVIEGLRFTLVAFLVFLMLSLLIKTLDDFYLVIKVIMAAQFTCFIDMLLNLQYALLFTERLGLNNINSNWNSNTLGCNFAAFIVFSVLLLKQNKIKRLFLIPHIVIDGVFSFFILLTGSRKSVIMLVLFVILIQVLESRKRFWFRLFFSLISVLFGWIAIMNIPVLYKILGYRFEGVVTGTSSEGSYIGRSKMIKLGLKWFEQSPLLGYGLEAFRAMSPWNTYAHTNYVELLVDLGIVGVTIYYSWFLVCLLKRKRVSDLRMGNYVLSTVIVFAVLDFMQVSYNDLLILFFIFTGFTLIDLKQNEL